MGLILLVVGWIVDKFVLQKIVIRVFISPFLAHQKKKQLGGIKQPELIEGNTTDIQELINKAWNLKKEEKLHEALQFYEIAFDILLSEAATASHAKGIIDKMETRTILPKYFDEARHYLKQDKTAAVLSNNMAVIFAELGYNESAQKLFQQSIELTPSNLDYQDPFIGLKELSSE